MSTSYTEQYVQRTSDGIVYLVQVVDTDSNTVPLKPEIYRELGAKPPLENLPDEKDYLASR